MTSWAATAYACVAYRIMEYEGKEMSEEYFDILLEMLFGFYTEKEIVKIYEDDIVFNSYDAVINDGKIRKQIE